MYGTFVGKNLKTALKEAGMTQEELAKILKTKHSVISRWISGGRNPKLSTLKKIASATKKNLGYFINSPINTGDNSEINTGIKIESANKRIVELEKENAYLKGKIEVLEKLKK